MQFVDEEAAKSFAGDKPRRYIMPARKLGHGTQSSNYFTRVHLRWTHATRRKLARDLIPLYIRLPEAEEKWEKKHGNSAC